LKATLELRGLLWAAALVLPLPRLVALYLAKVAQLLFPVASLQMGRLILVIMLVWLAKEALQLQLGLAQVIPSKAIKQLQLVIRLVVVHVLALFQLALALWHRVLLAYPLANLHLQTVVV
jgi:hypothetical protein